MPQYKVTYFDLRGRAEVLRLLLAAAGQKFEDNRLTGQQFGQLKPNTPWGSLPVVEVDGKELAQTPVIIHYIANQHGLGGGDHFEQALVDSCVMTAMDLWSAFSKFPFMPEGPQKEEAVATAKDKTLPTTLGFLDKFIGKHGKDGRAVGSKLTSADIAIFNCLDQLFSSGVPDQVLGQYPNVKNNFEKTARDDKLAAYLKSRK